MSIDFASAAPVAGNLDVRWVCGESPAGTLLQVHEYEPNTFILRQDRSASREAPFLFLLFGNERALLLDTGATKDASRFPLRETVDGLIAAWLERNPRDGYALVVAHTHGHNDHVAGDSQFAERDHTTVVPREIEAVRSFFRLGVTADAPATFDLGGRVLDVLATPGHHPASISIYDRWTGLLFTGDTVYPARLYASDMPGFVASLDRLVEYAQTHPITCVVGCHVEMSRTPRKDYPLGARRQPDEPPLQMSVAQLTTIRDAARSAASHPGVQAFDDFVIYAGPCRWGMTKLLAGALFARLTGR